MRLTFIETFENCVKSVTDPRFGWQTRHKLVDILFIGLCSILCGGDGYDDMALLGKQREPWFSKYLELPFGVPSKSTFKRVFEAIAPKEFTTALQKFAVELHALQSNVGPNCIALDGKSARRSFISDQEGKRTDMLHTVSAYATSSGLCLGQVSTNGKSNEITAIPELLELLDITGAVITIDAMGCQKEISKAIRAGKGDYLLALKANHPELHRSVEEVFSSVNDLHEVAHQEVAHTIDKGHGRIEQRSYLSIPKGVLWGDSSDWKDFRSIVLVESTREIRGKQTKSRRYYISSLEADSHLAAHAIRKHWRIESMHWVMDMVFREDYSRTRAKNGQANMKILRRWSMNILKNDKIQSVSLRKKRWIAAMETDYLEKLLFQSTVLPS